MQLISFTAYAVQVSSNSHSFHDVTILHYNARHKKLSIDMIDFNDSIFWSTETFVEFAQITQNTTRVGKWLEAQRKTFAVIFTKCLALPS